MTRKNLLTIIVTIVASGALVCTAPGQTDEDSNAPAAGRSMRESRAPERTASRDRIPGERSRPFIPPERVPPEWIKTNESAVRTSESRADRKVRQQLQMRIPTLDLPDTELEDVIGFIRELSALNFHVKWAALEQVGIDKSTTVNVRLANVTVEKALETILDDVGAAGERLGFIIDQGVITISTRHDLSKNTVRRSYDVRELIDWTDEDEVGNLVDLITTSIDEPSWKPTGDTGSVKHLNGTLVIVQTAENHAAVVDTLRELHAMQARRPTSPRTRARQVGVQIKLVGTMKETCFDPAAIGLIAVAGVRDEVPRDAGAIIEDLEDQLGRTKALGLRNAIRLTLKDLYKAQGDNKAVLSHLRRMLAENDKALQE